MAKGGNQAKPGLTDDHYYQHLYDHTAVKGDAYGTKIQLDRVVRLAAAAELLKLRLARQLREDGRTWDEVGSALGMTRQGAQRFLQRSTHDLGNN